MSNQKVFSILIVRWIALPSLAMFLIAGPVSAQNSSAQYTFLVASGLLCNPDDSATCSAVVKSANDESYEMSGAGIFDAQSKSVTAAGTFAHKSSDGTVLETGVWIASRLISFDSYGIAPGRLMGGGLAPGPPQFGPRRWPMFSGSMAAGGRAVFRIRLLPVRGEPKLALLQVNCALGKVPPEHPVEGIRLALPGSSSAFDEEVSGRTLFVLTRPGATAAKAPTPQVDTNPAPDAVEP